MISQKLNEDSPAAASLQPRSRAYDDHQADVDAAIEMYQKLNQDQKQRYWNYFEKVFADSAWVRNPNKQGKNLPVSDTRFNKENAGLFFCSCYKRDPELHIV
jgi:hypothetical protein